MEAEIKEVEVNVPVAEVDSNDTTILPTVPAVVSGNVAANVEITIPTTSQDDLETNDKVESINTNDAAMEVAAEETIEIQSNVLLTPAVTAVDLEAKENEATVAKKDNTSLIAPSGLGLLAQYDSDNDDDAAGSNESVKDVSDSESVIEVAMNSANKDYRTQVVEINSDSDSDSSSDSDVEYLTKIRKQIDKSIAVVDDDDDDDDDDEEGAGKKGKKRQPPKVKGEMLLDDLPPIQDLHITVPEAECVELGRVHSIIDQLMLVSALPNSVLLDLDTVLFLERGQKVLGAVFDVLGQVADPLYCVRFNSNEQIHERGISIGDTVYVAPKTEYTQFVILSSLMKIRGSDASWEHDIEPPTRYIEYSDDEQEQNARKERRNKDRPNDHEDPMKRARCDSTDDTASITSQSSSSTVHQRGRNGAGRGGGGGGNYRSRHSAYNDPSPSPPPHGYYQHHHQQQQQRPNYNTNFNPGSWHSNYYQPPPHHRGGPPPNYRMPPPHHNQYYGHPNSMFSAPPSPFNSAYGMPPQMPTHHQQQQPSPMYAMNPYGMRPSILPPPGGLPPSQRPTQNMYSTPPPPPPPGSQ